MLVVHASRARSYVAEFVAHHHMLGVEKLLIFNDNLDQPDEDRRFRESLAAFVDAEIVEVRRFVRVGRCATFARRRMTTTAQLFDDAENRIPVALTDKEIRRIGGKEKVRTTHTRSTTNRIVRRRRRPSFSSSRNARACWRNAVSTGRCSSTPTSL